MALLHMDNFSLLDQAKTAGTMDYRFLKLRYEVIGSPTARIQTISSKEQLIMPDRAASPSVTPWYISYPLPAQTSRYVFGARFIMQTTTGSNGVNTFGLFSQIDAVTLGMVFGCRFHHASGAYSLYLNYRDQYGTAAQQVLPLPGATFYLDFAFDKISNINEYSNLTVNINNQVAFSDNAFCNYGSDLKVMVAGMLPYQETAGAAPFFAVTTTSTARALNFGYSMTDFYVSNGGKRYGNPTVTHANMTSATSDLEADQPLLATLTGVPNLDRFAQGFGQTDLVFNALGGEVAQLSSLVQSNDGSPIGVESTQGTAIGTESISAVTYAKIVGPVDDPSRVILS